MWKRIGKRFFYLVVSKRKKKQTSIANCYGSGKTLDMDKKDREKIQ